MDPVLFLCPESWQDWLSEHSQTSREILLLFYKKSAVQKGLTYQQALDTALCYGWIDGVRKKIDGSCYTIRFSPRKPHSIWSQVNLSRVKELISIGRMKPSGLKAFENRDLQKELLYSFEQKDIHLEGEYLRQFMNYPKGWKFFSSCPPYYQRVTIWWVISAKKEATRMGRLDILIQSSVRQERMAQFTSTH
ncbi:MAG: YdeI/OmpD-associated family protein [Chitinophagaceae bacterium]